MAKHKLSLHIGKIELVHYFSCRDESVKMPKTVKSPIKSVICLGVHMDENLTIKAYVQSVLGKMAKHLPVVIR